MDTLADVFYAVANPRDVESSLSIQRIPLVCLLQSLRTITPQDKLTVPPSNGTTAEKIIWLKSLALFAHFIGVSLLWIPSMVLDSF